MSQQTLAPPEAAPAETVTPKPGREANGRFKAGNPGGVGNPFGRRQAALREAILRVVTPEVIEQIFAMLAGKANNGDVAATKLLLQYAVGTPKPMVEPDRVNIDEWNLAEESWVDAKACTTKFTSAVPVGLANVMADAVATARTNDLGEMLIDQSKVPPVVASSEDEDDDNTPLSPEEIALAKREWNEFKERLANDPEALALYQTLVASQPSGSEQLSCSNPPPPVTHRDKRSLDPINRPSPTDRNGPQPGCSEPPDCLNPPPPVTHHDKRSSIDPIARGAGL